MKNLTIYQTLENRGNFDEILQKGPFSCNFLAAENGIDISEYNCPWVGDGFYFWDSSIENAHWWGKIKYRFSKNGYVICKSSIELNDENCLDLHNNYIHRQELLSMVNAFKINSKLNIYSNKAILLVDIINFWRFKLNKFAFDGIRFYPPFSKNLRHDSNGFSFCFTNDGKSQIDLNPAIQICLFEKDGMNRKSLEIVFPEIIK